MAEFNKYEYHIPWPDLKEHFESLKEQWLRTALEAEGEARLKASGRVLQLMDLLNLPNTLAILDGEENEDGTEEETGPEGRET